MLRVFVSHSSQNAWLIHDFIGLIHSANPDATVFCSSEDSIQPGTNYKEAIFANLQEADVFVAILSNEYWESKYCILELGAAYERYCLDEADDVSIQPVLLPPLEKGMALANTPLVELQLTNLTDPHAIALFLRKVAGHGREDLVDRLEVQIAQFAAFVHRSVLATSSLVEDAEMGAYYDEPPRSLVPKERIVRCHRTDDDGFLFEFRLSRLDYVPSFASVALQFWNEANLKEYLAFDEGAQLCFSLDNVDGALSGITVELKCDPGQRVFHAQRLELVPGENALAIPLAGLRRKPLDRVCQICFVVHPEDMASSDGETLVSGIKVRFGERNRLA